MSALIKSGAGEGVRVFAPAGAVAVDSDPLPDPRDAERDALREEVARLTAALADAEAEAGRKAARAREEGERAGAARAAKREEERLDALRDGVSQAVAAFGARLDLLDGLAPQLARAALAKLFEPAQTWSAMVEAALARQLGALRRASLVAVRVSPSDFADAAALQALGASLGAGGLVIDPDPDLAAGACRIECRLGQVDLDVRAQWAALAELLDAMAAGEAA